MVAVLASVAHLPADDASSPPPSTPSPATPPNTPSPAIHGPQQTTCKVSVTVPRDAVGFIIGKRGETVRNMMSRSRAFIHVDRDDTNPHAPHRVFHIQGDPAAVAAARALIKEKVYAVLHGKPHARVRDALVQTHPQSGAPDLPAIDEDDDDARFDPPLEMWIPRGCVGMIIGHGGQVINEMQEKAGATIVVHNNKMDRNGAKLLTISGGHAEKLQAKHLIQNVLDRAGSRLRYMDHPHDAPHFFPPHPSHPHPHAPPWPYPQNTPITFDPRQPLPEFVGMHPLSPWMHPVPLAAQNVRPIIQQHPTPQTPQTPQQHLHHHMQQQIMHQQSSPQNFAPPQPHQEPQQQQQQLQLQLQPQPQPQQPQQPPPPLQQEQQPSQNATGQDSENSHEHTPKQELEHPTVEHSTRQEQIEPQLSLSQSPPQRQQRQTQQIPQPSQPRAQIQPHSEPRVHQQALEAQAPPQTAIQQHQRLQTLQAHQQQIRQVQPGMFAAPQLSSHVNPVFGQHVTPTPTPIPWNPAHVPYSVPPHLSVHANSMMANHPMYKMNTKVVCVPSSCVGIVIGRSGETIRDLQQRSGAYIKVTPDRDAGSSDPERLIYISGPPGALELAHSLVNDVINEGLSRNYRDGVEPRAVHDSQSIRVEADQAEPKGDHLGSASDSNTLSEPEGPVLNGKSDQGDISASQAIQNQSMSADTGEDSSGSPRLSTNTRDESENKEPEPGTPATAASGTIEEDSTTQDVPDHSEKWEDSQLEEAPDTPSDNHPNAFAGEGRLVQRPATDYPSASISFEMKIPHAKVGVIIGKKGQTIRLLQQKSGARIVVSKKIDTSREDNPRAVTITGPQPFVDAARRLIVAIINPPQDQKGEDSETALDPLDFDESLVGDDPATDALTTEFSNQSLTSPLPPIIPGSPAPISPMRVPQTPPYATYQRSIPFVGTNTPGQFRAVPPPYRPIVGGEHTDYRGFDSPLQQASQFQPQMVGPGQFSERGQITPAFPHDQTSDAEGMRPVVGELRQAQFFPHVGSNYAGHSGEGVPSFSPEVAGGVGPSYSPTTAPDDEEQKERSYQEDAQTDQTQHHEA